MQLLGTRLQSGVIPGMDPPAICRKSGVRPHPHPRFAGDRGSTPTPHPRFARIGGPTKPPVQIGGSVPWSCPCCDRRRAGASQAVRQLGDYAEGRPQVKAAGGPCATSSGVQTEQGPPLRWPRSGLPPGESASALGCPGGLAPSTWLGGSAGPTPGAAAGPAGTGMRAAAGASAAPRS